MSLSAAVFMDGEKLTFNVKYGIVNAAEATLEARTSVYQGTPVWYLTTNARTHNFFDKFFKIRDRVESWWDKESLYLTVSKICKRQIQAAQGTHLRHARRRTTFKDGRFERIDLKQRNGYADRCPRYPCAFYKYAVSPYK
jgi:hypothetical protein